MTTLEKQRYNEFRKFEIKSQRIKDKNVIKKLKNLNGIDYIRAYNDVEKINYTTYVLSYKGHNMLSLKGDCKKYNAAKQIDLALEYVTFKGKKKVEDLHSSVKKSLDKFLKYEISNF